MIKRINLIEVQPFAITYMRLVQLVFLVVALNFGAASWEGYRISNKLEPQLSDARARVQALQAEKKNLDKKPVVKKQETLEVGEYQDLFELLSAYPKWAGVVEDITTSLPNAVWLTGVTSAVTQKSAPKEIKPNGAHGDDVPDEKPSNLVGPDAIKLTLTGLAADVDGLSLFVKNMQSSEHFSRTTIGESQKESFGFQFTLESYLNLDYVEQ